VTGGDVRSVIYKSRCLWLHMSVLFARYLWFFLGLWEQAYLCWSTSN